MRVPLLIHLDKYETSEYWSKRIRQLVKDTGSPVRAEIQTLLPESSRMRRWVMGGLIPLAVYMDNQDYKDHEVLERYFEHYKQEFNPIAMRVEGKVRIFGQSTKGSKALSNFAQKLQDYLHEQHGIGYDNKVMIPDEYKKWQSEIAMSTTDDFIEYAVKMKWINKEKMI